MKRFLALGDSYTIGEAVKKKDRWPEQLAARLRFHQLTIADPLVLARAGWTTADLLQAMEENPLQGPYDLVIVGVGMNNQLRGLDLDDYRSDLARILERAKSLGQPAAPRVVVLSIPDWSVTPFAQGRDRQAIGEAIDAFNLVNLEETARRGLYYLDVTGISRKPESGQGWLADDGLHPGPRQYSLWAEKIYPIAWMYLGGPAIQGRP